MSSIELILFLIVVKRLPVTVSKVNGRIFFSYVAYFCVCEGGGCWPNWLFQHLVALLLGKHRASISASCSNTKSCAPLIRLRLQVGYFLVLFYPHAYRWNSSYIVYGHDKHSQLIPANNFLRLHVSVWNERHTDGLRILLQVTTSIYYASWNCHFHLLRQANDAS